MSKAYDGVLETKNIKIGGQRILVAASTASPITEKITDITSPPSGWRDMGLLDGNAADVTTKKEIFALKGGLPESTLYQEVVAMEATIKATLNEWSMQNIWEAMGRPDVKNTLKTPAVSGTIGAGTTRNSLVLGSGEGSAFAENDVVVVDVDASCLTSANIVIVSAVNTDTLTITPMLANAPTVGHKVKKITGTSLGYGDTNIVKIQAAILFDAKDGTQIIHYIPSCALLGEYSPQMAKSKQQVTLPIQLDAYGVVDADFGKTIVMKPLIFY